MIAIARKSLSLFRSPNSFISKPDVPFLLCNSNSFSTSRVKRVISCPEMYDVLVHKHQFSPELASLAASHLPKARSPIRADSILSFLEENSFTTAQIEGIVGYDPRILGFSIENMKLKLKVFQDLGFSSEEIAKLMAGDNVILHLSMKNKIIPSLSKLKDFLGSNEDVARLLRKSTWFLKADLENTLIPNVEILKSYGIPTELILRFLYIHPRCFLAKPNIMRKSVFRAIEIGVTPTRVAFIGAVAVFSCTSEGIWEVKLQTLRDLGFSDDDISTMFRKTPTVFAVSANKMKNVIEILLATGKFNTSNIVTYSVVFGCSIEKRIKPRLQILGDLESRNLMEKWPALGAISNLTDDAFLDRFVRPFHDEIGKECITKLYGEGKKR